MYLTKGKRIEAEQGVINIYIYIYMIPWIVIKMCFLTQFQWREAIVLDNWQLVELPQSGGREFDSRLVHDNLSVPLWVYMRFPVP